MRLIFTLCLLLFAESAWGQQSAFNTIFLSKPNALADRYYLGCTNVIAGTNITLKYIEPDLWQINSTGGGGGTNSGPPGPQGPQGIQGVAGTNAAVGLVTNYFTTNPIPLIALTGDATGSGSNTIAVTVTNIHAALPAQGAFLALNATGIVWSNVPASTSQTNIYATNLMGLIAGTNIAFSTNGHSLVINSTAITNGGGGGNQTPWLQDEDAARYRLTNASVVQVEQIWGGTNYFSAPNVLFPNGVPPWYIRPVVGNQVPGKNMFTFNNDQQASYNGGSGLSSGLALDFNNDAGTGLNIITCLGWMWQGVRQFSVWNDPASGSTAGLRFHVPATSTTLDGQINFTPNGIVTIGNDAATWALTVDQNNSRVVLGAGTVAYGNGGGLSNILWAADFETNGWRLNGNTLGQTNSFLGTLDKTPLVFKVNNIVAGMFGTNHNVQLGESAAATATSSTAVGVQASATAQFGVAVGSGARASGNGSVAVGQQAIANANYSTAVGYYAVAGGIGSFACGNDSPEAYGLGSCALGSSPLANNDGSFVWSDSTEAFTSDSAPNQFIVTATGGVQFYTGAAAGSGFGADYFEHYRAGNVSVAALATSKVITFSAPMASASYAPTVTAGFSLGSLSMYVDTLTASSFVVHFSGPVAGGTLYYTATLNQ